MTHTQRKFPALMRAVAKDEPKPRACPMCGSDERTKLGMLGNMEYCRCRRCGWDYQAKG